MEVTTRSSCNWPRGTDKVTGLDANVIRQSLIDNGVEWNHTGDAPETNLDHDGLSWKTIFSAGHGVGIIKDKPTAAELIDRMKQEYQEAVRNPAA